MTLDQSVERTRIENIANATFAALSANYWRHATVLGIALFGLYVAITLAVSYFKPQTDWDALAYIAVAMEARFNDPTALHAYVYDLLKSSVKPAEYATLTQADAS